MATRKVWYCGHSRAGVDVAMPNGLGQHVDYGAALETDDEHARSLLDQPDNWAGSPPGKGKLDKEG